MWQSSNFIILFQNVCIQQFFFHQTKSYIETKIDLLILSVIKSIAWHFFLSRIEIALKNLLITKVLRFFVFQFFCIQKKKMIWTAYTQNWTCPFKVSRSFHLGCNRRRKNIFGYRQRYIRKTTKIINTAERVKFWA